MTTLREAAQQALEALEQLQGGCTDSDDGTVEAITVWCPEIIEGLRNALAQQEQEKPMNECNHEYELDFRSSIHICKHCGTMRSNRPTQKPAGWLYDLEIDGQVVKDWFTRDESEAKKHANVRPLYFGRSHD